jgi:hypothetical protein
MLGRCFHIISLWGLAPKSPPIRNSDQVFFPSSGIEAQSLNWKAQQYKSIVWSSSTALLKIGGVRPCFDLDDSVAARDFHKTQRHTLFQPMEYLGILPARDFSNSKLKPEPLRLSRRIHLGLENGDRHSPGKHFNPDKPSPRTHRPSTTEERGTIRLVKSATSGLAALVAKFEMLGVAGDANASTHRQPLNPVPPQATVPDPPARSSRRTHHKGSGRLAIPVRGTSNTATDKITAANLSLAAMIQACPSSPNGEREAKEDHTPENSEHGGTSGD